MEPLQMPNDATRDQERFFQQVFDGAQGSIIDLDTDPAAALAGGINVLQAGQIGRYSTNLFIITPDGTRVKLTGASW